MNYYLLVLLFDFPSLLEGHFTEPWLQHKRPHRVLHRIIKEQYHVGMHILSASQFVHQCVLLLLWFSLLLSPV